MKYKGNKTCAPQNWGTISKAGRDFHLQVVIAVCHICRYEGEGTCAFMASKRVDAIRTIELSPCEKHKTLGQS